MFRRTALLAASAMAALLLGSASAVAAPTCKTPVAKDGHEPVCNPYQASDWAVPHRNSYEQDSTPYQGPKTAKGMTLASMKTLDGALPFVQFSPKYPNGESVGWFSMTGNPDAERVGKVNTATNGLIDLFNVPLPGLATPSGAYNVLSYKNELIVGKGLDVNVYADAVAGNPGSGVSKIHTFKLPENGRCGPDDRLIGIIFMWNGQIAYATAFGTVGVFPVDVDKMSPENVKATTVTDRGTCTEGNPAREEVSNSIAADEKGAIYTVTSQAQYKHTFNGSEVKQVWRVKVPTDGLQGGVRIGPGSGSSPTLMGTSKSDDKLVVITDGRKVMNYMVMWRDSIPKGWKSPVKGLSNRVACYMKVDFGNSKIKEAQSEQSVAVRGNSGIVVNNSIKDPGKFAPLPGSLRYQAATLASGDPDMQAFGVERIDWDPKKNKCRTVWGNQKYSIPNAIPTISSGSNMVYGIGARKGVWGLEGIDMDSGKSKVWFPAGEGSSHNSFYAQTEIATDGTVWTGVFGGIDRYKPATPAPALKLK